MAIYNPPTEDLAIFDNSVFVNPDTGITQSQADLRYLRFPNAQGTETLQAININGLAQFNSGINQTDSSYINTTVSTGEIIVISGGSITNTAGTNTGSLNSTLLTMNDSSAGINKLEITNSSITYEEDSGGTDQLIISSNTTNNPILIQSNGASSSGGGITLESTAVGSIIKLETVDLGSPSIPSQIMLKTGTLSGLSNIILDTNNVFIPNGYLNIMVNPSSYGSGLRLYENPASANNCIIHNTAGTLSFGGNGSITNMTLNATQTGFASDILITQITYPPSTNNALGYSIINTPFNYISSPYISTTTTDTYTGQNFTVVKKGVYLFVLTTYYSSPTTASVRSQSSNLSTSSSGGTANFILGVELNNANVSVSTTGLQHKTIATGVVSVNADNTIYYYWIRSSTSGTYQDIGISTKYTKIG